MKCLLDMDGVIVDFVRGAAIFHGHDPDEILSKHFSHEQVVDAFGMEPNAFWDPLGEEFWAGLEPYPEMAEVVRLVEGRFGRRNVCILSSPTRHRGCMPGKLRWLKKHLPGYQRQFLFGPSKEFCAGRNRVLIDDRPANVEGFTEAGGIAYLVPRTWNARKAEEPHWTADLDRFLRAL